MVTCVIIFFKTGNKGDVSSFSVVRLHARSECRLYGYFWVSPANEWQRRMELVVVMLSALCDNPVVAEMELEGKEPAWWQCSHLWGDMNEYCLVDIYGWFITDLQKHVLEDEGNESQWWHKNEEWQELASWSWRGRWIRHICIWCYSSYPGKLFIFPRYLSAN